MGNLTETGVRARHGQDGMRPDVAFFQPTARARAARLGRMSTRTPSDDLPVRRIDRILAFMSLGLLVLSIACFVAILIGSAPRTDSGTAIWTILGCTAITRSHPDDHPVGTGGVS